ncbi:hypothetical protein [Methanolobus psychrotolerans]|uniref:hypothetical protein n=1 Tax=Methanolobus psychrotolerans TaxID=1874706 RepID=UPI000B91A521|nr:hypothetical protein [Methanolobus psychrotolerans]
MCVRGNVINRRNQKDSYALKTAELRLVNVFDNEAITLIDNDIEIKVMWSAVATLKETKKSYHGTQTNLNDFKINEYNSSLAED